jgi:hypothetical protein
MVQWHRYINDKCSSLVTSAVFIQVGRVIVITVVASESEVSDSVVVVQARIETQLSKKERGKS